MLWNLVPGWGHAVTFLVYLAIFTPLELVIPAQRGRKLLRPGWVTDVTYFFINVIPISILLSALIGGSMVFGDVVTPAAVKNWMGALPVWLQVIIGTVIADLFFYAGHRLQHEVPWLWNFHAVHHSSEQLDWLAAFRVHPVDQLLEKGTSLFPIFALGFSRDAIIVIGLIYQWQSILIHSNVRLPVGWLKWLVATPQFHHWHHAKDAAGHNKNFSGQLPLWDIVFGTVHLPPAMPDSYGINEPMAVGYPRQMLRPFQQLAARLPGRRQRQHALRADPPQV